jgi:hypothetical protein
MSPAKDSRRTRRRVFCIRNLHPCLTFQPVKDRRQRPLQTGFGTVDVEAQRYRICRCRLPPCVDEATFSPVSELLPGRCTPELERIQAEMERVRRSARAPGSWRCRCLHHQPAMSASAIGPTPSLGSLRQPAPSERPHWTAMYHYKTIIGRRLHAWILSNQRTEAKIMPRCQPDDMSRYTRHDPGRIARKKPQTQWHGLIRAPRS